MACASYTKQKKRELIYMDDRKKMTKELSTYINAIKQAFLIYTRSYPHYPQEKMRNGRFVCL